MWKDRLPALVTGLAAFAVLSLPHPALAQDGPVPVRIRHVEGGVTVQRAQAGDTYDGVVNLPLEAGDRLWTAAEGRVELSLADATNVWVDAATTIDIVALASGVTGGETILRLWSGSLILERPGAGVGLLPLRVDASNGSAVLADLGTYRVDIDDDGRFWLSVFDGRAELVAGGLAESLTSGQRSFAEAGTSPAQAVAFNTAERDGFAEWQEGRLSTVRTAERYVVEREYVPREVVHYAADLEPHGNWVYHSDFGSWAWRPRLSTSWSPYRHGRWVHGYGGWSFVPHEPWGWVTVHYGRWHHLPSHGWVWFPGYRYSPAWVHWYVGSGYVGWSPIGYYNRPLISFNFFFGGRYGRNYYDPGYHGGHRYYDFAGRGGSVVAGRGYVSGADDAWTVVPADRLGSGPVERTAVGRKAIPRLPDNSVTLDGPLRPRDPTLLVPGGGTRTAVPRGTVTGNGPDTGRPGQRTAVGRGSGGGVVAPRPGVDNRGRPTIARGATPTDTGRPAGTTVAPRPTAVPRSPGDAVGRPDPERGRRIAPAPRPQGRPGGTSVAPRAQPQGRPTGREAVVIPRPEGRPNVTRVVPRSPSSTSQGRPVAPSGSRFAPRSGTVAPRTPTSIAPRSGSVSPSRPAIRLPSAGRPSTGGSSVRRPAVRLPSFGRPSSSGSSRPPSVSRPSVRRPSSAPSRSSSRRPSSSRAKPKPKAKPRG